MTARPKEIAATVEPWNLDAEERAILDREAERFFCNDGADSIDWPEAFSIAWMHCEPRIIARRSMLAAPQPETVGTEGCIHSWESKYGKCLDCGMAAPTGGWPEDEPAPCPTPEAGRKCPALTLGDCSYGVDGHCVWCRIRKPLPTPEAGAASETVAEAVAATGGRIGFSDDPDWIVTCAAAELRRLAFLSREGIKSSSGDWPEVCARRLEALWRSQPAKPASVIDTEALREEAWAAARARCLGQVGGVFVEGYCAAVWSDNRKEVANEDHDAVSTE